MCTVSVIFQAFTPFPDSWYNQERIDLFRRMVEDARALDALSNQPDCEDPDKAKLEEHILELEQQLKEDNK